MRALPSVLLLVAGVVGCGDRTPLAPGAPGEDDAASPSDASQDAGPLEGGDPGYAFCAAGVGPIPESEVPDGSLIHRCDADFPHCVFVGDAWACCNGPGPYDGPTGGCYF